jgi:signal transduction histidine kinase
MMTHKGTVLIVDDEPEWLGFLCRILAHEGYRVLPACGGEQALATLAANSFDLILLDIRMPSMDGFEVCRRLKRDDRYRTVPVILLSTLQAADLVEGVRLGAVDFLDKPFRTMEVLARVESHIELARRGRLERNFRTSEDRLKRSRDLEGLGLLAGGVAHDFNSFLGSILLNSEVALEELDNGSPARGEIERIRTVSLRAAEVVSQLMNFAVHRTVDFERTDLPGLVAEMAGLMRCSISKTCQIKTDLLRAVPSVRANPAQLRQVVMNLIRNASDAIGDGAGVITLKTSPTRIAPGDGALPEGDYVSLEVTDTGCGMSEETRAKIFDPFFTTKFEGRGLGLAALRSIMAGHGASIDVASAPGRGTTFRILLPCWREAVPLPEAAAAARILQ